MDSDNWFLLYCKGKEEQRAVDNLKNQGIESFFVSIPIEKIIRGKKAIREVPLFPNYVFVKLDIKNDNFNSVRSTRGVVNFIKCGLERSVILINFLQRETQIKIKNKMLKVSK